MLRNTRCALEDGALQGGEVACAQWPVEERHFTWGYTKGYLEMNILQVTVDTGGPSFCFSSPRIATWPPLSGKRE